MDLNNTYAEREHGTAHGQTPDQHELVLGPGHGEQTVGGDCQTRDGGRVTVHGRMEFVVVQLINVFQTLDVQMPDVDQTVQTTCVKKKKLNKNTTNEQLLLVPIFKLHDLLQPSVLIGRGVVARII